VTPETSTDGGTVTEVEQDERPAPRAQPKKQTRSQRQKKQPPKKRP
jgi:hypothetical protein